MKQIVQHLSDGNTTLLDAPLPRLSSGEILINASVSLLSAGTERMLLKFGKASYWSKAKQQPEKVKQVLQKMKTDGIFSTLEAVRAKLEQPIPLGYCHVGVVTAVGDGVGDIKPGDRVVSNAPHAEVVKVSKNLCVRIPDEVCDDVAVFTVLSSIALQGIRNAEPTLGEAVVVMGLGAIGLLTVQLLKAQGCRVLAVDIDKAKLPLAAEFGAETCHISSSDTVSLAAQRFSRSRGVDAVLITAATDSNEPVSQAAAMCRKRGRIVLVGVTGLTLNRSDFYEKELSFQVSCSYGPGRYDPAYENQGLDYPIGYVRWTEARNFEACLDMMAAGKLNTWPLISHRFPFKYAIDAYDTLMSDGGALGVLLDYDTPGSIEHASTISLQDAKPLPPDTPVIALLGAGQYATRQLIPALKKTDVVRQCLCSLGSVNANYQAKRHGFSRVSTDIDATIEDQDVNTIIIATRHDSHANLAIQSLAAGRHVFVEKPLAIDEASLAAVESTYQVLQVQESIPKLMVGFNRRFSPHVKRMKTLLDGVHAPKCFIYTVNAGFVPASHWSQDLHVGGGRIIGEVCHFIDLLRFLVDHPISQVTAGAMGQHDAEITPEDKATITLHFEDGSFGSIHYFANGAKQFPKERLDVFTAGRQLQLDNFRRLTGYNWPGFKRFSTLKQEKGQHACIQAFLSAIQTGSPSPIEASVLFEVSRVAIAASRQIKGISAD